MVASEATTGKLATVTVLIKIAIGHGGAQLLIVCGAVGSLLIPGGGGGVKVCTSNICRVRGDVSEMSDGFNDSTPWTTGSNLRRTRCEACA
jgi:hypothetical protein